VSVAAFGSDDERSFFGFGVGAGILNDPLSDDCEELAKVTAEG
jgi:hypothetical protein